MPSRVTKTRYMSRASLIKAPVICMSKEVPVCAATYHNCANPGDDIEVYEAGITLEECQALSIDLPGTAGTYSYDNDYAGIHEGEEWDNCGDEEVAQIPTVVLSPGHFPELAIIEDGRVGYSLIQQGSSNSTFIARDWQPKVPITATITGLKLRVKRRLNTNLIAVNDNHVRLAYAPLGFSANRASSADWPNVLTWMEYGGPGDLWGWPLTPAIVNDPMFFAVGDASSPGTGPGPGVFQMEVDALQIIIYL